MIEFLRWTCPGPTPIICTRSFHKPRMSRTYWTLIRTGKNRVNSAIPQITGLHSIAPPNRTNCAPQRSSSTLCTSTRIASIGPNHARNAKTRATIHRQHLHYPNPGITHIENRNLLVGGRTLSSLAMSKRKSQRHLDRALFLTIRNGLENAANGV
jgi:hypothetical protein